MKIKDVEVTKPELDALRFGVDFFVEEVGQYRICYKSFEDKILRRCYFVGDHKEYEKWVRER